MFKNGNHVSGRKDIKDSIYNFIRNKVVQYKLDMEVEEDLNRIKDQCKKFMRVEVDESDIRKALDAGKVAREVKENANQDIIVKTVVNSIEKLEKDILKTYDEIEEVKTEMKNKLVENPEVFHQYSDLLDKKIKMYEMLLRKLGAIGAGITNVINKNITIDNRSLHIALDKQIEFIFKKNEATLSDGKLIFEKPTFELLETFNKYRKKENAETVEAIPA